MAGQEQPQRDYSTGGYQKAFIMDEETCPSWRKAGTLFGPGELPARTGPIMRIKKVGLYLDGKERSF